MNFRDPEVLHAFLLERIREKTEVDKLDFKLDLNFAEQRDKLNLIRLINALVNTYDLQFDDHGFLIYGMNREDGRVTRAVPIFRNLGTDKLENQIGQLLRSHVHPVPQFSVYGFEDPEVGPWGTIVIWPDQTPPFVFTKPGNWTKDGKTEQLWRMGEWRVRRNGAVVEPAPEDYAHMLQARVQAATGPLREEVRRLQAQVHRLEGIVQTLQEEAAPQLEVILLMGDREAHNVTYASPEIAGRRVINAHLQELNSHLASINHKHRDPNAPTTTFSDRNGWIYFLRPYQPLEGKKIGQEEDVWLQRRSVLKDFLDKWEIAVDPKDLDFSEAWHGSYDRRAWSQDLYGPDATRAKAYEQLLQFVDLIAPKVKESARVSPFKEFSLRLHNPSKQATGQIKVEVNTKTKGVRTFRFAPEKAPNYHMLGGHRVFSRYSPSAEVPLEALADQRDNLLPGETWQTLPFALRFDQPGEHELLVRVLGERLRGPQEFTLKLQAQAEA